MADLPTCCCLLGRRNNFHSIKASSSQSIKFFSFENWCFLGKKWLLWGHFRKCVVGMEQKPSKQHDRSKTQTPCNVWLFQLARCYSVIFHDMKKVWCMTVQCHPAVQQCCPTCSMHHRCGAPLGSAWRRQMETISKKIINSSNDMKTQTSKCHTFSVLLFHQISLYMQCSREFLHLRIIT